MNDMTLFRQSVLQGFAETFPGDERRVVFGEGPADSPRLMLIGEAPGAQQAEQGRPFVGKAGQNLNEFLDAIGLERPQIYISNVVKVRPSKVSLKGTISNRPPNRQELSFFTPFLHRELAMVDPGLVVTLGNTALQALMGKDQVIGDHHGEVRYVKLEGRECRLFPLYHPASIIYNRALKDTYLEDLKRLKAFLESQPV